MTYGPNLAYHVIKCWGVLAAGLSHNIVTRHGSRVRLPFTSGEVNPGLFNEVLFQAAILLVLFEYLETTVIDARTERALTIINHDSPTHRSIEVRPGSGML